ncbi:MAG: undecaprenyl/decaprenyl-phosphate alpha-N-acetylglucosaminyl 1-phosphate transferase [Oligoflexia bacterium]|nr:undecaprenyl/decaprenyl-phosphate alpha-N-acetylglucosaminyl 1-phosphate transferase [Oligoflexia bacterium]
MFYDVVMYPVLAFILSLLLFRPVKKLALMFSWVDIPNERKIHTVVTPRIGGAMIFTSFMVLFLAAQKYSIIKPAVNFSLPLFVFSMVCAFVLGFIDDVKGIRAIPKLAMQLAVGLVIAHAGFAVKYVTVLGHIVHLHYWAYPVTMIWVVTLLNAVNLIDGIDGLASGILIIAFIFTFAISLIEKNYFLALMSGLLTGSILGFYVFNFPPAKIFMGDGGAYFLGAMYATLSLAGFKKTTMAIMFAIPLVLLILPLFDIIYIVVRRTKRKENPFKADKNHIHHRLLGLGFSVRQINFLIYIACVVFGIISVLIALTDGKYAMLFFLMIVCLVFAGFWVIRILEKRPGG